MKAVNEKEKDIKTGAAQDATISHSKQKRIEREKKEKQRRRNKTIGTIVGAVLVLAIVGIVGWQISKAVIKAMNTIEPSSDYSEYLADNGFVKGSAAKDCVTPIDYKNLQIPLSEIEYSDASVEEDIQEALENHQVIGDADVVAEDGSKVNIDYVGTIDGVEFAGGSTNGEGSDVTIGSGSLIDDFEQQLIGHKAGDEFVVSVTFPDDYQSEEVAGKDADFAITMNGVYVKPDFDDDFVCAYYSDDATTADGYRQYLKDTNYESNLNDYIENYIKDNTVVNTYPGKLLKGVEKTRKYSDLQNYESMNQIYMQYYGQGFSSFEEYTGQTEEEYNASLETESKDELKDILAYQAILELDGAVPTEADYEAYVAEQYGEDSEQLASLVEKYGKGYIMKDYVHSKAVEIVKNNAKVQ